MTKTSIGARYVVEDELGSGGMGMVYRGTDTHSGQIVAIKQLKSQVATPDMLERFQREGQALRELNHPNIVKMLDAVSENDNHYLIMEYVSGGDLTKVLSKGPMTVERILNVAIDLADALTRAHKLNIIHRDLKPANVLIGADEVLRLTDFGVAHVGNGARLTETDALVGTIDYLPPEAFHGSGVDARGDIWAFGVMLFEMLAGKRPFSGDTFTAIITAILMTPLPDLERLAPGTPIALIDLIYRMLERDPNARMSSVRHVGAALEDILRGRNDIRQEQRFDTRIQDMLSRPKHNLPAQTTPFVGREVELAELEKLVLNPELRLITILAQGGMGKTRLSLELASAQLDSFHNGVYFVPLAPVSVAENIPTAIAEAVNFQFQPGSEPRQQLLDFFREKCLLLLIDNFEHLLDGVVLVSDILQAGPNVKVLATSRERLNLQEETLFRIEGLDFPDWETPASALEYAAVKLFIQSARRILPNFELQAENLKYLARICRLTEGMPLGILLAAAWVDSLSMKEIADEIAASVDFLETETRNLPSRHRSIRAVFDYSWNLLTETERGVYSRVAVFRGGFTRQAAEAITGASLRMLTGLVNKSLLRRDPDSGRYDVHELLRQYAEAQLEEVGNASTVAQAHSRYYLNALKERLPVLQSGGKSAQLNTLNDIADDMDNVQVALFRAAQNGDYQLVTHAIPVLWLYSVYRGVHVDFETILDQLVSYLRSAAPNPERNEVLGLVLAAQAYFCAFIRKRGKVEQLFAACHELLAENDLPQTRAALGLAWGNYHARIKTPPQGRAYLEQSLAIYQSEGPHGLAALAMEILGDTYWFRVKAFDVDKHRAGQYYRDAQQLMEAHGNWVGTVFISLGRAVIATLEKRYDEADQLFLDGLAGARTIGNQLIVSRAINNRGVNFGEQGKFREGFKLYEDALAIAYEVGSIGSITTSLYNLGETSIQLGEFDLAPRYFHEYMEYVSNLEDSDILIRIPLVSLGNIAMAQGRFDEAVSYFMRVNEINLKLGERGRDDVALGNRSLGWIAIVRHQYREARQYLESALSVFKELELRDMLSACLSDIGWLEYLEGNLEAARERLMEALDYFHGDAPLWVGSSQSNEIVCEVMYRLADVDRAEQDYKSAYRRAVEVLKRVWPVMGIPQTLQVLSVWVDLLAVTNQATLATEIASFIVTHTGAFPWSKERATNTLEKLKEQLPAEDYTLAVKRGSSLNLDHVTEELLAQFGDVVSA